MAFNFASFVEGGFSFLALTIFFEIKKNYALGDKVKDLGVFLKNLLLKLIGKAKKDISSAADQIKSDLKSEASKVEKKL